jgi:DUF4097 and DUF4098 domain-containing protein YvlB
MRRKLILGFALAALAVPAFARIDRPVTKSFAVREGGRLVVRADQGSIEVRSADASRVDVTVHRIAKTDSPEKAEKIFRRLDIDLGQQGDTVTVQLDVDDDFGWFDFSFGSDLSLKTVVTVPRRFNVELGTSGGDIAVSDVSGDLRSSTSGGDVTFSRVQGKLKARTSGGDIRISASRGEADLSTSGGDVHIDGTFGPVLARTSGGDIDVKAAAGTVDVRTSGGDIDIRGTMSTLTAKTSGGSIAATLGQAPSGQIELGTSGGQITLALPPASRFNLDAASSGGRVSTDFPIVVQGSMERDALSGSVNGGGSNVRLRSSAGGIRITKTTK